MIHGRAAALTAARDREGRESMTVNRRFESGWRRSVAIGITVSVLAHAMAFAWVRFSVDTAPGGDRGVALRVVPLPEQTPAEAERPMRVVELTGAVNGGAAASTSPATPSRLPISSLAPVPAMEAATPRPVRFLETLEERDEQEPAAATYARVSDFLVNPAAEPGPFRPIDDRPVDVLARLSAGRGTGLGAGSGGGHCPPRDVAPTVSRSRVVGSVPSGLRSSGG